MKKEIWNMITIKEKVSLEARRTRQEKVRSLEAKNSNLKKKEMLF